MTLSTQPSRGLPRLYPPVTKLCGATCGCSAAIRAEFRDRGTQHRHLAAAVFAEKRSRAKGRRNHHRPLRCCFLLVVCTRLCFYTSYRVYLPAAGTPSYAPPPPQPRGAPSPSPSGTDTLAEPLSGSHRIGSPDQIFIPALAWPGHRLRCSGGGSSRIERGAAGGRTL